MLPPVGAPEGAVWFGGPMDWLSVRLLIKSKDVVPTWITNQLGLPPTNFHVPNMRSVRPNGSLGPVRAEGFWQLTVKREEVGQISFEEAAVQLLGRLTSDVVAWRGLPARPVLIFSLGMPRSNCGFNISPALASLVGERDIVLGFDIYGESIWSEPT